MGGLISAGAGEMMKVLFRKIDGVLA